MALRTNRKIKYFLIGCIILPLLSMAEDSIYTIPENNESSHDAYNKPMDFTSNQDFQPSQDNQERTPFSSRNHSSSQSKTKLIKDNFIHANILTVGDKNTDTKDTSTGLLTGKESNILRPATNDFQNRDRVSGHINNTSE